MIDLKILIEAVDRVDGLPWHVTSGAAAFLRAAGIDPETGRSPIVTRPGDDPTANAISALCVGVMAGRAEARESVE